MGDRQLSAGLYGLDSGSNTYPVCSITYDFLSSTCSLTLQM